MIYYRDKINSFTDAFHNCSVIVLVSQNYNLLQKEAQIERMVNNAFCRDMAAMQTINQRRFLAANARARESLGVPAAYGAPVMMPPTDRLTGALQVASSVASIYGGFFG